jgi:hypothetical protein
LSLTFGNVEVQKWVLSCVLANRPRQRILVYNSLGFEDDMLICYSS